MNPIQTLERELAQLEASHAWLGPMIRPWGTGSYIWDDPEKVRIYDRVCAIQREVNRLRKVAGLHHKTSSLAHGGRR